jgi:hypothetical protein
VTADQIAIENSTVDIFPLYPSITETFGANRTFSILLRPDNYIGYLGAGLDLPAINDYLSQVSGRVDAVASE